MITLVRVAGLAVLSVCAAGKPICAFAQQQFEVASVKPGASSTPYTRIQRTTGGVTTENTSLRALILFAYDLREYQLSGGPGWLESDRWDVSAKIEGSLPPGDEGAAAVRTMMRALLAERFGLVVHRQTKEMPIYALVAAKTGSRLKSAAAQSVGPSVRLGRGQVTIGKAPTAALARALSTILSRTVVDETGLKGDFDMNLEYVPEQESAGEPGSREAAVLSDRLSIFTALQEQLGLRLESKKGPVEFLVVDQAEKATENE